MSECQPPRGAPQAIPLLRRALARVCAAILLLIALAGFLFMLAWLYTMIKTLITGEQLLSGPAMMGPLFVLPGLSVVSLPVLFARLWLLGDNMRVINHMSRWNKGKKAEQSPDSTNKHESNQ